MSIDFGLDRKGAFGETVYITGHKNPDSDSICAAIAYADLKKRKGYNAIPIRLGELKRETEYILNYFGIESPEYKDTMKPQISDVGFDLPNKITPDVSLNKTLNIIQHNSINGVQVVDEEDKLTGIVTISDITNCYMDIWDSNILERSGTTLENILEVLSCEIVYIPEEKRPFKGRIRVYAMEPEAVNEYIKEWDVVIVGNREDAQRDALTKGVSLLILTIGSDISEENLEIAKRNNVTVVKTQHDSFLSARLIPLSTPVSYIMSKENLVKFYLDDYLDDIMHVMGKSRFRSYPIVDHNDRVMGSISRYHLITNEKKKLILVDHNEKNQSVQDIEDAEIIEIIDHHRVANINTDLPVFFRNEPVGSTCTIVAKMFFEQGISPSREIAGILAAAIISDTLLLRSPTATDTDRRILERLAKISNLNVESFASDMFRYGTSLENKSAAELLSEDVKQFDIEGQRVRVAQVLTMDLDNLESVREELLDLMTKTIQSTGDSTFLLLFTDIIDETSEMLVVGKHKEEIAEAFGAKLENDGFSAPGILSRKKQVIPVLTQGISNSGKNS